MTGSEQTPSGPGLWQALAQGADTIELAVPAQLSYLGVVRTATAGLAARLSFTLDAIEDLRIAVDEACLILLALPRPAQPPEATLTCRFQVLPEALAVEVSAGVAPETQLELDQSFAWRVLTAHATDVTATAAAGTATITLVKRRS